MLTPSSHRGTPCICAHPAGAGEGRPGEHGGHGRPCHISPPCLIPCPCSTPQPSARLETLQRRGFSANPGASPTVSGDRDTMCVCGMGVADKRGRQTGGDTGVCPHLLCNLPPQVDLAVAWRPWPGRPVKNRWRKLLM